MAFCVICGKRHAQWCPNNWALLSFVENNNEKGDYLPLHLMEKDKEVACICNKCMESKGLKRAVRGSQTTNNGNPWFVVDKPVKIAEDKPECKSRWDAMRKISGEVAQ